MKLLFSILLIPLFIVGPLALLTGGWVYFDRNFFRPDLQESFFHLYMALLHFCTGAGILLSGLSSLYAAIMCIVGFVVKTWFGAILAGGMALGFFVLLLYLLEVNL